MISILSLVASPRAASNRVSAPFLQPRQPILIKTKSKLHLNKPNLIAPNSMPIHLTPAKNPRLSSHYAQVHLQFLDTLAEDKIYISIQFLVCTEKILCRQRDPSSCLEEMAT